MGSAARHDLLNAINDESDRLNRLVGNLLEMSRIEAGAQPPARSSQDIGELVADVVNRMSLTIGGTSRHHRYSRRPAAVQINYTQIDQVLTNLIENAVKYTPADTPIAIEADVERDTVRIEVRDQGPGIPAGLSTRIFEKFVRVAGPERHADGMGLGLAICKGIIEHASGPDLGRKPADRRGALYLHAAAPRAGEWRSPRAQPCARCRRMAYERAHSGGR